MTKVGRIPWRFTFFCRYRPLNEKDFSSFGTSASGCHFKRKLFRLPKLPPQFKTIISASVCVLCNFVKKQRFRLVPGYDTCECSGPYKAMKGELFNNNLSSGLSSCSHFLYEEFSYVPSRLNMISKSISNFFCQVSLLK